MTDITAARALADAATPGPWEVCRRDGEVRWITQRDGFDDPIFPGPVQCMAYCYGGTSTLEIEDADAELITAARTLVPELCDEVERLRAVVARVEALARDWPCSDETCDGECTGCAYGRDLRDALRGES